MIDPKGIIPSPQKWPSRKAYEQASQSAGCLLLIVSPFILLVSGCLGCGPFRQRNHLIPLFLAGTALILTHFYFLSNIKLRKRWAIVAMLFLASFEILSIIAGLIYILTRMNWQRAFASSFTSLVIFTLISLLLLTFIWTLGKALWITQNALIDPSENKPQGFQVIVTPPSTHKDQNPESKPPKKT